MMDREHERADRFCREKKDACWERLRGLCVCVCVLAANPHMNVDTLANTRTTLGCAHKHTHSQTRHTIWRAWSWSATQLHCKPFICWLFLSCFPTSHLYASSSEPINLYLFRCLQLCWLFCSRNISLLANRLGKTSAPPWMPRSCVWGRPAGCFQAGATCENEGKIATRCSFRGFKTNLSVSFHPRFVLTATLSQAGIKTLNQQSEDERLIKSTPQTHSGLEEDFAATVSGRDKHFKTSGLKKCHMWVELCYLGAVTGAATCI